MSDCRVQVWLYFSVVACLSYITGCSGNLRHEEGTLQTVENVTSGTTYVHRRPSARISTATLRDIAGTVFMRISPLIWHKRWAKKAVTMWGTNYIWHLEQFWSLGQLFQGLSLTILVNTRRSSIKRFAFIEDMSGSAQGSLIMVSYLRIFTLLVNPRSSMRSPSWKSFFILNLHRENSRNVI